MGEQTVTAAQLFNDTKGRIVDANHDCHLQEGVRQNHQQFARRKPGIERMRKMPWLLKLDDDLGRLLLAGSSQWSSRFACRIPDTQFDELAPYTWKLKCNVERRVVAER